MKLKHAFRRIFAPLLFLFAFIVSSVLSARAQNAQNAPVYVAYTYYKIAPGRFEDYKNLATAYSKKINDYLIQQGNFMSWSLYDVLTPVGTSADYNVVSVSVSNKIESLLDLSVTGREMFAKNFPDLTVQQADSIMKRFSETRTLVKKEIYMAMSNTMQSNPMAKPSKYVEVDYMTPVPGKEAQYAKMETDKFLKVHQQRIAMNVIKGWVMLGKMFPSDSNDPTPYVTVNFVDDISAVTDGKYTEAVKKAWPNEDMAKLFAAINTVKKGQRTEVWKLVLTDSKQGS